MCGRVTITKNKEELEKRFHAEFDYEFTERYNGAPNQRLPVITNAEPKIITGFSWGLQPIWLKQVKSSGGIINVRMENLRNKQTFASDLLNRRCLVLVDGFYEWQKQKHGKQPYRIIRKDEESFALAGIWEENKLDDGSKIKTFAIVTTEPNEMMKPIHNRMPVALSEHEEQAWLETTDKEKLLELLDPAQETMLKAYEVDTAVNNPAYDAADLIKPLKS